MILCSKGIGKKYITSTSSENTKFNNDKTKDYYTTRSGHKIALPIYYRNNLYTEEEREKLWKYGYIWLSDRKKGFVNEQTINYITKYVTKVDLNHKEYKPLILCSKGIGKKYITSTSSENTKFNNDKTKDYYTTRNGHKIFTYMV